MERQGYIAAKTEGVLHLLFTVVFVPAQLFLVKEALVSEAVLAFFPMGLLWGVSLIFYAGSVREKRRSGAVAVLVMSVIAVVIFGFVLYFLVRMMPGLLTSEDGLIFMAWTAVSAVMVIVGVWTAWTALVLVGRWKVFEERGFEVLMGSDKSEK